MYYQKVNEIKEEQCFGEDALISAKLRNATIKSTDDEPVHFATLSRVNFELSLKKIEQKRIARIIEFLKNIPCFKH